MRAGGFDPHPLCSTACTPLHLGETPQLATCLCVVVNCWHADDIVFARHCVPACMYLESLDASTILSLYFLISLCQTPV